jgi:tRNA threonylcarbamoyladenosine biosynthesis protein TsaE
MNATPVHEILHWSSRSEAERWAQDFVKRLRRPCAVLLEGDLGAGKTQLVKWFLSALGVRDAVSPTFAIHQRYRAAGGDVDHVDLYRLKSALDLESSGFWDLFSSPDGLVFVEWADRLPEEAWPREWMLVRIRLRKDGAGEESRRAEIEIQA